MRRRMAKRKKIQKRTALKLKRKKPARIRTGSKRKPRKMQKRAILSAKARKETFGFPLPLAEPRPLPPPIPRHEPLDIRPFIASEKVEEKKRVPHAANALLASAILTAVFAAIFIFVLGIEPLFSLGISMAIFLGFSILIFNILETGQPTALPK